MNRVLKGADAVSAGSTRLPVRAAATTTPPAMSARAIGAPIPVDAPAAIADTAEIAALHEQARRQGFEQGQREASTQAAAALVRVESQWSEMATRVEAAASERLKSLEDLAVAVAFEACARVLGEASVDGAKLAGAVRQLLARARETALLRVQLSPGDLTTVEQILRADPQWAGRALRFEADAGLGAGQCRVLTAHGQLETGLATQLAAIQEALLVAFDAGQSAPGTAA